MKNRNVPIFVPKRPRVEMIPLIDMFFLLLVFFIFGVFSMSFQEGIVVDLPPAESGIASTEDTVTISVDAEGRLFLNQEPVAIESLTGALRAAARGRTEPLVAIQADRRVPHGTVMAVLDAVRQAGLGRVSFQTAPEVGV